MPLPSWATDLATLDLLLSVAETGSVGGAARAHGISQPSASERLARLERLFGVPLLVRTRRGSTLTPTGEAVVAWIHPVVDAAQALADGVLSLRADQRARLRLTASLTVAEYLLPRWLLVLRRGHADLEISASVANSADVCAAIRSGRADLGFVESPDVPADLGRRVVGTDGLALVVAARYPLAARADRDLRAGDLVDVPLLLREPGSGTRETFLRALAGALGRTPSIPRATSLGSTATILATVRAGGGVGVVSARAAAAGLATGELVRLRVADLALERPLHAVWSGQAPSPLAAELIDLAISLPPSD
ncbi:LysR family transcriptional regulator [Pseudofrankia inefficax]|uniref:Transcriptional regulator, LysR family n=1 Tax=Pseudofrankia inefficax (strain DSM 45817 / CECT 9037 / DDB 130130 / EuI1c) TaxID=298654 RepID=E3JD89_PSEI1|nr:LysR family transcriptional regulator [Pseudofrankia inefficax]ADP82373.1 transcriptional regulator, LysR family [Pseudofrankia inefficax]